METTATYIGGQTSFEDRLRHEWCESLKEHMAALGYGKHDLMRELKALGYEVSRQTVENWMNGVVSPRPLYQAALGTILNTPARRLFPIENLPAKEAS